MIGVEVVLMEGESMFTRRGLREEGTKGCCRYISNAFVEYDS